MGFLDTLFGGSKSESEFQVKEFPGVFDDPKAKKAAEFAQSLADLTAQRGGREITPPGGPTPVTERLGETVLSPELGPRGPNEQAFVQSLIDLTQGQSALRGTGPATVGTLSQVLAPQLLDFRKQRVGELGVGSQAELAERGQDIQAGLGAESLDLQNFAAIMQSLLALTEEAAPVRIGGTTTKQTSTPGLISILSDLASVGTGFGLLGGGGGGGGGNINLDPQFGF